MLKRFASNKSNISVSVGFLFCFILSRLNFTGYLFGFHGVITFAVRAVRAVCAFLAAGAAGAAFTACAFLAVHAGPDVPAVHAGRAGHTTPVACAVIAPRGVDAVHAVHAFLAAGAAGAARAFLTLHALPAARVATLVVPSGVIIGELLRYPVQRLILPFKEFAVAFVYFSFHVLP